ncbi:hypothetical protein Ancab_018845, partial [Ancistrocladus abbreviatus]
YYASWMNEHSMVLAKYTHHTLRMVFSLQNAGKMNEDCNKEVSRLEMELAKANKQSAKLVATKKEVKASHEK